MSKIVISILHYNNQNDTIGCLDSIEDSDLRKLDLLVFVLDNGSKEKLNVDIKNYKSFKLEVVRVSDNLGFTGGHNYVYKHTRAFSDFFLLLNNDSILQKEALKHLESSLVGNIAGVVPKIYFTKGREYHKTRYAKEELGKIIWYAGGEIDWGNVVSKHFGLDEVDNGQFDKEIGITFATGACLLLRSEVIDKIGLFDDRYFLYYEDADLSKRISNAGYELKYIPEAIVWHSNAGSSGSGSELHDYYLTRNKLLFGMKFAPIRTKALLLKEALRIGTTGRKWQRKGVFDFFLNKLGKGSYAK